MPEDLTIVFANLGQWENLNACLTSLYETTSGKYSFRVIVGFNFHGSSDTPQRLAAAFPRVELLRAPAKLGYCRAYNLLMAESNSRYVVLLDDDTILRRGTIDGMVAFMDEHPEVGIASCRTVNPDGTYQKTTARMYDLASEIANVFYPAVFWQDGIDGTLAEWRQAGWLNSHFLIVRSEIIDTVGVLDEYYYTFQCEADWCLRIRRRGWKIAYLPGFEIMHIGGAHSVTSSVKSYKNLIRSHLNRYYFMRKHYGMATFQLFRLVMSFGALFRLMKYSLLWLLQPSRRPEATPKIKAFYRIMLRGIAPNPGKLPQDLQQESNEYYFSPISQS